VADRRSFWPTVLVGLAGAVLACVAAARPWTTATTTATTGTLGPPRSAHLTGPEAAPLALALALVALAGWGAMLVLRRRGRRVVAVVGLLASLGLLATALLALGRLPDLARGELGQTSGVSTTLSGWYVVTLVGGMLTAAAFAVAVREAGQWPEMGSRYDAPRSDVPRSDPTGGSATAQQDLWKAIDEGHDPTA
jgi:uncharacterized membrane protein (TIGR02234 family)